MLTKFLDCDKIYNFCFNEKIVTQKNLSLQAFVIATLENSFGRSTLGIANVQLNPSDLIIVIKQYQKMPLNQGRFFKTIQMP